MPTILIVDDEHPIVTCLERFFTDNGYNVTSACTPQEALKYDHQQFQVALLDVTMPAMTGPDLAAELRKYNPDMKIIFMSGYVFNVPIPDGDILVHKPFTLTALLDTVDKVIGQPCKR